MATAKIVVFSASLRNGSYNTRLADQVEKILREKGAEVTRLDLSQYPLPVYDANLQEAAGIPAPAHAIHEQLRTSGGVFIATPEYNAGVPPLLSNVLAWVSRIRENGGMAAAFHQPVYALGAASPGVLGGYRGLMALRQMLELSIGSRVLPTMISIANAGDAFDEAGGFKNPRSADLAGRLADQLIAAAGA